MRVAGHGREAREGAGHRAERQARRQFAGHRRKAAAEGQLAAELGDQPEQGQQRQGGAEGLGMERGEQQGGSGH